MVEVKLLSSTKTKHHKLSTDPGLIVCFIAHIAVEAD